MLNKLKTHRYPRYFFLYAASYFAYGATLTGLGPYIPYLTN